MMLNINTAQKAETEVASSTKAADDNDGFKAVSTVSFNEPEEKEIIIPAETHFGKKPVNADSNTKSSFSFGRYSVSYGRLYAAIAIAVVVLHIAFAGYIEYSNKKTQAASNQTASGIKTAEKVIDSKTVQATAGADNKGVAPIAAQPALPTPRLVKVTDTSAIGKSEAVSLSNIQPAAGAPAVKNTSGTFHPVNNPPSSANAAVAPKPLAAAGSAQPSKSVDDTDIINILNKTN